MKERHTGIKVIQVQFGAAEKPKPGIASLVPPKAPLRQLNPKLRLLPSSPAKTKTSEKIKTLKPAVKQRVMDGLKRFEAQAARINQLSAELETAMLELKAISREINPDWRAIQLGSEICEYYGAAVPCVGKKQGGSFVLTMRPIDLLKAEREAASLAQDLRQRTRRKKLKV